MEKNSNKEIRQILAHFGFDHQLMKLAEEAVELADAAFKLRKDFVRDEHHGTGNGAWRNLAEETADVLLLLEQIAIFAEKDTRADRELIGDFWTTVYSIKEEKKNRVLQMIAPDNPFLQFREKQSMSRED